MSYPARAEGLVNSIILGCIFSMLFSDFRACVPISIPTPPITALTEFFHADDDTNVHPLLVSWYLISLLWMYLCSCMHIMSMLWSIAEAVSSGSWPILFEVLMLNITICFVLLHFSNFCFSLNSVSDFSIAWDQGSKLSRTRSVLPARREMRFGQVGWVWVMVIFRWLFFYSHL